MAKTYCPNCDSVIVVKNPRQGSMIRCFECGVELEVIETNPSFEVDFPFDDEDWDDDWDNWDDEEEEDAE